MDKNQDVVNKPSHYTDGKIEVIDFIEDKALGFHLGNVVKYVSRAGKKDPAKTVEDLQKAKWYLEREIERITVDPYKIIGWGKMVTPELVHLIKSLDSLVFAKGGHLRDNILKQLDKGKLKEFRHYLDFGDHKPRLNLYWKKGGVTRLNLIQK